MDKRHYNPFCSSQTDLCTTIVHDSTFTDDAFDGLSNTCKGSVRKIETVCVPFCTLFPLVEEVVLSSNTTAEVVTLASCCTNVLSATIALTNQLHEEEATQICHDWHLIQELTFTSVRTRSNVMDRPLTEAAVCTIITQCCYLQRIAISRRLGAVIMACTTALLITQPCRRILCKWVQ